VKIFGLFGKKNVHHVRGASAATLQPGAEARDTSKKIDAIESEMSAEFGASLPGTAAADFFDYSVSTAAVTLPQIIEEAAILFANNQAAAAQSLLAEATSAKLSTATPRSYEQIAWWMQFELAQLTGTQQQFEQLAIAYAHRFETSPPQWINSSSATPEQHDRAAPHALSFRGKLCGGSRPLLEQLKKLGGQHPRLNLEFNAVADVDHEGCVALLALLDEWQTENRELMITGAVGLINKLRSLIQTGRRDADESAWRLLIELHRLLNEQAAHEEVCIDYCITYEISPPPFVAPAGSIPIAESANFLMPALVNAPIAPLLQRISRYAENRPTIVLDCAQLGKIDFIVAATWLVDLERLAGDKPVELRNTNFLVSVLLKLVGTKGKLSIITRKP